MLLSQNEYCAIYNSWILISIIYYVQGRTGG